MSEFNTQVIAETAASNGDGLPKPLAPREDIPAGVERAPSGYGDDCPWLSIALNEIGEREIPGRDKNNPRILAYHQTTSLRATDDETPWCSSFVNWSMDEAGETGTDSAAARSWEKWGVESPLRRGAVVVLRRGDNEWQGHVGVLLSWNDHFVQLVSGNVNNEVEVSRFPRSDVIAVRWPKRVSNSTTIAAAGGEATTIAAEKLVNDPTFQKMVDMSPSLPSMLAGAFLLLHAGFLGWIIYQRYLRMRNTGT